MILLNLLWLSLMTFASAQVVQNGQVFTNGLAIIDSPQPNTYVKSQVLARQLSLIRRHYSPLHAGSSANIAIDVGPCVSYLGNLVSHATNRSLEMANSLSVPVIHIPPPPAC